MCEFKRLSSSSTSVRNSKLMYVRLLWNKQQLE